MTYLFRFFVCFKDTEFETRSFEVHICLFGQIEIFPFLELIPESEIEHSVWRSTPIIGNETFVETTHSFHFKSFDETVEDVAVQKAFAVLVDAWGS